MTNTKPAATTRVAVAHRGTIHSASLLPGYPIRRTKCGVGTTRGKVFQAIEAEVTCQRCAR